MIAALKAAVARLVRASRLRRLKGLESDMQRNLEWMERKHQHHSEWMVELTAALPRRRQQIREVRAKIAKLEDPAKMLGEALARRSDIH